MLEKDLAETLGLSVACLREWRRDGLTEGEDWGLDRRRITYTESGQKKILKMAEEALKINGAGAGIGPIQNGTPAKAGEARRETLWVIKRSKNIKVIYCAFSPASAPTENVIVRSNANFIPGMEIPVKEARGEHRWYLARKCPRWKGRW